MNFSKGSQNVPLSPMYSRRLYAESRALNCQSARILVKLNSTPLDSDVESRTVKSATKIIRYFTSCPSGLKVRQPIGISCKLFHGAIFLDKLMNRSIEWEEVSKLDPCCLTSRTNQGPLEKQLRMLVHTFNFRLPPGSMIFSALNLTFWTGIMCQKLASGVSTS